MSQREQVLEYLKANPNSTPVGISEALKANRGSIAVLLNHLKKEGHIESPEYGKYRLRQVNAEKMNPKPMQPTQVPLPDLRNPEIMLAYKDAYGKEQFLEILNKIKRLIE